MEARKVGSIGVDSGTVLLTDPCYGIPTDEIYEQLDTALTASTGKGDMAIAVRSGYGDGVYPVWGVFASHEETKMGERCLAVLCDFSDGGVVGSVLGGAIAAYTLSQF